MGTRSGGGDGTDTLHRTATGVEPDAGEGVGRCVNAGDGEGDDRSVDGAGGLVDGDLGAADLEVDPGLVAELEAAATMADGRAAENALAAMAGTPLADLETVASLRACIRRGEAARTMLLETTQPLVAALARHHDGADGREVVLLEAGEAALGRAIDRYDPTGGLPFRAFARWWVERAMREVDLHPVGLGRNAPGGPSPADPALLTALGHLHEDDCRVIELRLGLSGPALTPAQTAKTLGVDETEAAEREERALAKLRHPCTPGNLTHLTRI